MTPAYNLDVSGSGRIRTRLGIGMAPVSAPIAHGLDVSGYTYVYGGLGINADPADYTLNLNGNFYASEGGDTFSFSSNADGIVQATAGYNSLRGTLSMAGGGDDQIIGTIKKGIIVISALDSGDSTNRAAAMFFAYDSTSVATLSSSSNGYLDLTPSNTYLMVNSTNPSAETVTYSITYFPLP
jgi:hypothetical protein